MTLSVLDLFSGIGGFSLGLERTGGFKTVAFCEIDPFCRRVLAKHWPEVPCYNDVRELTAERLAADGISVDVICGGFPCQDISIAGLGAGLTGERSGLWSEYARIIGEIRPTYIIVENVAALLSRGLDRVLGDLAALGFDAEWHCIPASAVGAPHRRDRVWIVAHAERNAIRHEQQRMPGRWPSGVRNEGQAVSPHDGASQSLAHANSGGRSARDWNLSSAGHRDSVAASSEDVSVTSFPRLAFGQGTAGERSQQAVAGSDWWTVEPDVGRVAHGVPARVDRLKGLGNAVVPQIPELIGRAILASQAVS